MIINNTPTERPKVYNAFGEVDTLLLRTHDVTRRLINFEKNLAMEINIRACSHGKRRNATGGNLLICPL